MNKIISELQRRNVFRVAGAYAVAAWLLAQMAGVLENSLNMPPWFDTVVVSFLLIGFPVALILAWAFEMTPEGVKLTAGAPEGESLAPKTGRKLDYAILGGVALVAVMFAYDRLTPEPFVTSPSAAPQGALRDASLREAPQGEGNGGLLPEEALAPSAEAVTKDASIAVLPFADLSPGKDQEYFSDGMAEEILNVLARVDGLTVASRTSSFAFKGQDTLGIPAIAKELNVRHVLEGSVRKAGGTIRITAQLIDSNTDKHLWSETFDRPLTTDNVFIIQDEIAQAIVGALSGQMAGAPTIAAPKARAADTADLGAYELYLKGHQLFIARGRENLLIAMETLRRAIEIDPAFARAHESLSAVYAISRNWGIYDDDYELLALEEAETALRLNPALAQPYATRAFVGKTMMLTDPSWTWDRTFADLDEAVRRDPKNPTIRFWRGLHYTDVGFFERAVAEMKECFSLDPAYQNCRRFMAIALLHLGREDEAMAQFEAGLRDGFSNANLPFAAVYAKRGERAAALALITLTFGDAPHAVDPLYRAMTGEDITNEMRAAVLDLSANPLRASRVDGQTAHYFMKAHAGVANDPYPLSGPDPQWFRQDPSWVVSPERKALIRRLRLPEYWRRHGFPPQCKPLGKDDFACE